MASNNDRKSHPISMHLPEADIALMEYRLIRMSPAGFGNFIAVLAAPARPVPEMVELARRPAPWEPGAAKTR